MIRSQYVLLDPRYLLIDHNFVIDGKRKLIRNEMANNDIKLTLDNLNAIRRLSKIDVIKSVTEYYGEFAEHLNLTTSCSLNWKLLLGENHARIYSEYLKKSLKYTLNMFTSYHTEVYPERIKCYKNLHALTHESGSKLEIPKYKHDSVTGRTGIIQGFNYLTMKKADKKKLVYPNDDYVLLEVDFRACEPNFFLRSINKQIDDYDVYSWLAKQINFDIKDRTKFKRGVLAIIYGADVKIASKLMKLNINEVNKIKQMLSIDMFENALRVQFDERQMIYNFYGRPITSDKNLVNYWIQSSAVDYCSLAFKKFIEDYDVKPCFLVHDSLTFAIAKDRKDELMNVKFLCDNYSGYKLPVEINVLAG